MFIVDANVFMQAANSYYAFDLAPRFWSQLEEQLGEDVFTVAPVKAEILGQKDQLSEWLKDLDNENWILPVDDEATQMQMPVITQHCVDYGYKTAGISKFLAGADPWVIAKARELSATVVTHEIAQPETKKRVKIPDVCSNLQVESILLFDMLRSLGVKL